MSPAPVRTEDGAPGRSVFPAHPDLDAAITRSQSYLLSEQKPEGYWVGELMVDVTLVADMVAFYHWWGKVDPVWQRKAVHHIFEKQLGDGGWNIYPNGPAEVNATVKAYLVQVQQKHQAGIQMQEGEKIKVAQAEQLPGKK